MKGNPTTYSKQSYAYWIIIQYLLNEFFGYNKLKANPYDRKHSHFKITTILMNEQQINQFTLDSGFFNSSTVHSYYNHTYRE